MEKKEEVRQLTVSERYWLCLQVFNALSEDKRVELLQNSRKHMAKLIRSKKSEQ